MARRASCATCHRPLTGPLRGGRVYCSLECRPSYTEPRSANGKSYAAQVRAELLASGRPLESLDFITLLSLRRIAQTDGGKPNVTALNAEIARRRTTVRGSDD